MEEQADESTPSARCTHFVQLIEIFIPETVRRNEDEYRRARFLVASCALSFFPVVGIIIMVRLAAESNSVVLFALYCMLYCLTLTPLVLRISGSVVMAGLLSVVAMFVVFPLAAFDEGGLKSIVIIGYAALPLHSTLVGSRKIGVAVAAISCIQVGVIGYLDFSGYDFPERLTEAERALLFTGTLITLVTVCAIISYVYESERNRVADQLKEAHDKLLENNEELARLATTDTLTSVYNRRHLIILAEQEFKRSRRYRDPLAVMMIDVDHFKKINDNYGHLVGDRILTEIARRCGENLREVDIFGRYGGEEFMIVLPKTPRDVALEPVAERLRGAIGKEPFSVEGVEHDVTISIGLAPNREGLTSLQELIRLADAALYEAKKAGRNRVVCG